MNGPYTEEEKTWLRVNAPIYSYEKLATMLLAFSGRRVRPETLCEYCRSKLGIGKADNFGFKKGNRPVNEAPIGSEVVQKGRFVIVKVKNTGDRKTDWVAKTKIVYGNVPKGHIIVFLDGDSTNVTLENMECVTLKVHARMAKNRWFFKNPELTRTAIKWCEHLCVLKDFAKNGGNK